MNISDAVINKLLEQEEVRPPTKRELTNPYAAYLYARNVLRAPFPAGEKAIAKDADCAYFYARDILRAPFPAGEQVIAKDPWRLEMYKAFVSQWKEDREEFMKDLDQVGESKDEVRPPTKYELTDPYSAFLYARDILRSPWPAGEEVIASNSDCAYVYSRDVLKAPFPAGEEAIVKDPFWKRKYQNFVRQWKEDREEFMKDLDSDV